MNEPGQGGQGVVESEGEGGCIFVAIFSIAIATVPATFSNELAMLDIPSPAEMCQDLVGLLSADVAATLLQCLCLAGYSSCMLGLLLSCHTMRDVTVQSV